MEKTHASHTLKLTLSDASAWLRNTCLSKSVEQDSLVEKEWHLKTVVTAAREASIKSLLTLYIFQQLHLCHKEMKTKVTHVRSLLSIVRITLWPDSFVLTSYVKSLFKM